MKQFILITYTGAVRVFAGSTLLSDNKADVGEDEDF